MHSIRMEVQKYIQDDYKMQRLLDEYDKVLGVRQSGIIKTVLSSFVAHEFQINAELGLGISLSDVITLCETFWSNNNKTAPNVISTNIEIVVEIAIILMNAYKSGLFLTTWMDDLEMGVAWQRGSTVVVWLCWLQHNARPCWF